MNPRVILLLLRFGIVLLPALLAVFGRMGRGLGMTRPRLPPEPTEDIGKRPLMNRPAASSVPQAGAPPAP